MVTFYNWNKQVQFEVPDANFYTPTNVAEVQTIVQRAAKQHQQVTVIGAKHSTTECMVGSGVIISMEKMNRILSIDQENLRVTVEGGTSLRELCSALKRQGLQPGVILEFGNFQIGAISGTHANDTSVSREGQFSSFVAGVKLVTPKGEIIEISETQHAELLPFMRSHFGLFGVVCEVSLRVFNSQPLQITSHIFEIDNFIDKFPEHIQRLKSTQDQVFGMLFPHTGKLLLQCRKYVESENSSGFSIDRLDDWIQKRGISVFKDVLLPLVKAGSTYTPRILAELISKVVVEVPMGLFSHGSYYIDPCDRGILYAEDDPDFDFYDWVFREQQWSAMVRDFMHLIRQFQEDHDFVLPLPTLIYFIKKDQASQLSRSRHSDMIAVDPTYPNPIDQNWLEFRTKFNEVAIQHGGIPHINKTRGGAIHHYAQSCDVDILRAYLEKQREFDPDGLFLNAFYKTMFSL